VLRRLCTDSFGAADSPYPSFRKTQPPFFQILVSGYATASSNIALIIPPTTRQAFAFMDEGTTNYALKLLWDDFGILLRKIARAKSS
jgi:hypothetical protein